MIETVYTKIKEDLEDRINSGLWQEKLPGVAVLSRELDANPRTISKAIKLLEGEGKVMVRGRTGTFITNSKNPRPRFNIVSVVGSVDPSRAYQLDKKDLDVLRDSLEQQKLEMFSIDFTANPTPSFIKALATMSVDGYIFINSTLTADIAYALRQAGIPFVSVNRQEKIPGLNWVDFDHKCVIRKMVDYFTSRGFTRIALAGYEFNIEEITTVHREFYAEYMQEKGIYDEKLCLLSEKYIPENSADGCFAKMKDYARHVLEEFSGQADGFPQAVYVPQAALAIALAKVAPEFGLTPRKDLHIATTNELVGEQAPERMFDLLVDFSHDKRLARAVDILSRLISDPNCEAIRELIPMETTDLC